MVVICINKNTEINNNCGRLQDLILPFRIPMDTWKNFFEIYRHVPSERFAGPVLGRLYIVYKRTTKN